MRDVHKFVKESRQDVNTPEDLVTSLHHDGGISNCAAELVAVRREDRN